MLHVCGLRGHRSLRAQDEHSTFPISKKLRNANRLAANQFFGDGSFVVAAAKPDHLGRRAQGCCQFIEVGICRDDGEIVCLSVLPHNHVRHLK